MKNAQGWTTEYGSDDGRNSRRSSQDIPSTANSTRLPVLEPNAAQYKGYVPSKLKSSFMSLEKESISINVIDENDSLDSLEIIQFQRGQLHTSMDGFVQVSTTPTPPIPFFQTITRIPSHAEENLRPPGSLISINTSEKFSSNGLYRVTNIDDQVFESKASTPKFEQSTQQPVVHFDVKSQQYLQPDAKSFVTTRQKSNITLKQTLLRIFLGNTISHESKSISWWIFGIDLLLLSLLVIVPVHLAWTQHFTSIGWVVFYLLMDAIMLFDCWIAAKVDYNDIYGLLVQDVELTLSRYMFRNNGIAQVVASLPWELFGFAVADTEFGARYFGASRLEDPLLYYQRKLWAVILLIKVYARAPYLRIYQTNLPTLAVPVARLVKCMFVLMLMGHVDACLFWFIDSTLVPGPDRWIEVNNLQGDSVTMSTEYLVSYLAALRSLVLHLRVCQRDAETVYVIFEFMPLMDRSAALNQAEERHRFEMEGVNTFMKEKKIRPELQQMVQDYKDLQWQKSKGLDEHQFFVGIPKSVQQEIKNFLYLDLVRKVPVFQNTDLNFMQTLAFKIRPMHVLDGWTIFRKGDEAEEMFFIKAGNVEICSEDGKIIFVTLTAGGFFGEIALFESCQRTAMARAKGNCELCVLAKEDFNILLKMYPNVAEGIAETIRARKMQEEQKKKQAEVETAEKLRKEEEERLKRDEDVNSRYSRFKHLINMPQAGSSSRRSSVFSADKVNFRPSTRLSNAKRLSVVSESK